MVTSSLKAVLEVEVVDESLFFPVRTHVNSNVTLIKLQKQLAVRSNTVAELEGRYLQLQEVRRFLASSSSSPT